uniref:Uncharacterized protein n=1 Tax=Romanomermis culicivorax TaxID=13658 RepID=A0A915IDM2_ROMCU
MQIDKLDDQQRRHLHRSEAPKEDQKVILGSNPSDQSERRAKGPGASLLTASSGRPTRGSRKVWGTGLLLYHQGLAQGLDLA